jgi:hypothetical protein
MYWKTSIALARRLTDCEPELQALVQSRQLEHPAQYRLAFRELGKFRYLADTIEKFWGQPTHQQLAAWRDHLDINSVMLAISRAPDAYLFADPTAAH